MTASTGRKESADDKESQNQKVEFIALEEEINDDSKIADEKGYTLVIAFLFMLLFQLGNRIFGRLETFPMHNYPLFLNMLSTVIYIPICFAYVIPIIMFTNTITKEQREIPKYKFAVMGAYDSLAGIMQTFAVNYISSSSVIVLVQQSAIPISMAISRYALQSTYTNAQYIGAAVVLLGIVVVLIPTLISAPEHSQSSEHVESNPFELLWILVLVVSCVPMCLSSVYKEKALGETEIDVMYLNGWVAVFQFIFAIPLCIPSAQVINMPLNEIMPNMYGGMLCWMGINSITEENVLPNQNIDNCSSAPFFVTTFLAFNIVYNFLIIVILKHGSANILWMASTVIVPLSNVAFSLKFMPGSKPLTFWDLAGLFVIMFGLVIYRFSSQILELWDNIVGKKIDIEEVETSRKMRTISKRIEKKQINYVGLNQIEALQSLVDTRVMKAQKISLFRSPGQIRSKLLVKLGIPPSPLVSIRPGPVMLGSNGATRQHSFIEKKSSGSSPLISYQQANNSNNNYNNNTNNNKKVFKSSSNTNLEITPLLKNYNSTSNQV